MSSQGCDCKVAELASTLPMLPGGVSSSVDRPEADALAPRPEGAWLLVALCGINSGVAELTGVTDAFSSAGANGLAEKAFGIKPVALTSGMGVAECACIFCGLKEPVNPRAGGAKWELEPDASKLPAALKGRLM